MQQQRRTWRGSGSKNVAAGQQRAGLACLQLEVLSTSTAGTAGRRLQAPLQACPHQKQPAPKVAYSSCAAGMRCVSSTCGTDKGVGH